MTKILCTLILLISGQSVFSSAIFFSGFSEASEHVLLTKEQPEKIEESPEIDYPAGLQKDLHRMKIFVKAGFGFFCRAFLSTEKIPGEIWEISPNLSTAKIIYPFHSFP